MPTYYDLTQPILILGRKLRGKIGKGELLKGHDRGFCDTSYVLWSFDLEHIKHRLFFSQLPGRREREREEEEEEG